ncbi:MAG: undecaprenyl-diphosphate phosphatase [Deltaproteobacteria bacterium]
MSWVEALILGVLQGFTEFLPVSSSGHLALAQTIMGGGGQASRLSFVVALHVGTLLAVLVYFRRELAAMALTLVPGRGEAGSWQQRWVGLLAAATLPIVAVGLGFADAIEAAFSSLGAVGTGLLATAALLASAQWRLQAGRRAGREERPARALGLRDALLIGAFQAVAVFPGVSRSGACIAGALLCGLERGVAARFAFLLSIPAISGATILHLPEIAAVAAQNPVALAVGTLAAASTGWLAIDVMMRAVGRGRLLPFALYCSVLGALTLAAGVW